MNSDKNFFSSFDKHGTSSSPPDVTLFSASCAFSLAASAQNVPSVSSPFSVDFSRRSVASSEFFGASFAWYQPVMKLKREINCEEQQVI
jgi:hypothetical protein